MARNTAAKTLSVIKNLHRRFTV